MSPWTSRRGRTHSRCRGAPEGWRRESGDVRPVPQDGATRRLEGYPKGRTRKERERRTRSARAGDLTRGIKPTHPVTQKVTRRRAESLGTINSRGNAARELPSDRRLATEGGTESKLPEARRGEKTSRFLKRGYHVPPRRNSKTGGNSFGKCCGWYLGKRLFRAWSADYSAGEHARRHIRGKFGHTNMGFVELG